VTRTQAHYLLSVVKAKGALLLARCARLPWHRVPVADRTRDRRPRTPIEHRSLIAVCGRHRDPHRPLASLGDEPRMNPTSRQNGGALPDQVSSAAGSLGP
jgi:hypothetical protein